MSLKKESLTHKIEDDLALRNRNWDKLTSHLAESAKKHITESGSNASGSYIKFDDGTLICYRKMSLGYQSQRFLAPPSNARWAYPAGYIEAPNVQISKSSTWTSERYTFANIGISGDAASAEVRLYSAPDHPFASDDSYSVHLFAIGRWKA